MCNSEQRKKANEERIITTRQRNKKKEDWLLFGGHVLATEADARSAVMADPDPHQQSHQQGNK